MRYFTVALISFLVWFSLGLLCRGGEHEYRLKKYLLSNYDVSVRPVHDSSLPQNVSFGVSLHQIVDVDIKNQILTTNCWLSQIWIDTHLTWNASDFGGIKIIQLPYLHVWRPDVILYNNADSQYNLATINTNVIVENDGKVIWMSQAIYKSSCDITVEYFPFDIQSCTMRWASWTYDGYSLDLIQLDQLNNITKQYTGDISNYQTNGEFKLESFTSLRQDAYYSCCEAPYPFITYTIRIRRRPLFYVFNLILPCVLINSIALLVFYVPSESGEKVTLGISALLSMIVFLMTIRESLPPTEKTPLITLYYGVSICLVSFASAMAVVTLNIHFRGLRGAEIPAKVKMIFIEILAKIVFLKFHQQENKDSPKVEPITSLNKDGHISYRTHIDSDVSRGGGEGDLVNCVRENDGLSLQENHAANTCDLLNAPIVDNLEPKFVRVLEKVSATIDKNEERCLETDKRKQHELEWKQVSLVIDRILLLVFFLAMTIASLVILTSSPHLDFSSEENKGESH